MATYVLVHGAWGGAHGFRKLRPLLTGSGHQVFTPSLTGIGERAHLTSPEIGLDTHVRDVVNHILYEDLEGIVLLGFSYGGAVVTGALQHVADRVEHLVFLDAFVPGDGDSVWGLLGVPPRPTIEVGEQWLIPPTEREYDDPAEAAWAKPRRTGHPVRCFTQPVGLLRPLEEYPFTRTYIKATADDASMPGGKVFWAAAERARSSPAWHYHEIHTNHMVANNRPQELAQVLLALAQPSRSSSTSRP